MSAVAVLLIAVGCSDLLRPFLAGRRLAVAFAPALVLVFAALCGLWHRGDVLLIGIAAAAATGWRLSDAAADGRSGPRQAAPLLIFPGALLPLMALSGFASPIAGPMRAWWEWAQPTTGVTPTRAAMAVGVVLLQLATANIMVRLLLKSVGAVKPAGQPQPSDKLKGGRLLGPMERLLIVGLGLAGQLSVATAVIAAKSIIRFPEINAQKAKAEGGVGIDDITEYFLIGSLGSWMIALGGLALTAPG